MTHKRCRFVFEQCEWKGLNLHLRIGKCKCGAYRFYPLYEGEICPHCQKVLTTKEHMMIIKAYDFPVCEACQEEVLDRLINEVLAERKQDGL